MIIEAIYTAICAIEIDAPEGCSDAEARQIAEDYLTDNLSEVAYEIDNSEISLSEVTLYE